MSDDRVRVSYGNGGGCLLWVIFFMVLLAPDSVGETIATVINAITSNLM